MTTPKKPTVKPAALKPGPQTLKAPAKKPAQGPPRPTLPGDKPKPVV
jgi:hypothetical protein